MTNNYPPEIQKRIEEIHSNFNELIEKANNGKINGAGGPLDEFDCVTVKLNHLVELVAINMVSHEKLLEKLNNYFKSEGKNG